MIIETYFIYIYIYMNLKILLYGEEDDNNVIVVIKCW